MQSPITQQRPSNNSCFFRVIRGQFFLFFFFSILPRRVLRRSTSEGGQLQTHCLPRAQRRRSAVGKAKRREAINPAIHLSTNQELKYSIVNSQLLSQLSIVNSK